MTKKLWIDAKPGSRTRIVEIPQPDGPAANLDQAIKAAEIFSHDRWHKLLEDSFQVVTKLSVLKGAEYSGDFDRLANFRRNSRDLGVPMELVWRIYAAKHWDAIGQYCADLVTGRERQRLEPIEGRIDDLLVYLLLFKAILSERQNVG